MPNLAPIDDAGVGAQPRHATVLVCDDDRLVLLTLAAALRGAGFEVIEADNGDDAILLARQHHPDIALLDIRMDGKSGLDVASYLRDYVGTPFMFLSAFSDELFIRKAREFGALDYLVKPVDIEKIPPAVSAALRRAAQAESQRLRGSPGPVPELPSDLLLAAGVASPATPETRQDGDAGARRPLESRVEVRVTASPAAKVTAADDIYGPIAVGILMERFRLTRAGAELRLAAMARQSGRPQAQISREFVRGIDALNAAGTNPV